MRLANKALHQTRRGGVAAARPVVEARLAGEGRCWTGPCGASMSGVGFLVGVVLLACITLNGCGAFTNIDDLVVANPAAAVQAARKMIDEQSSDPERHKGWLNEDQLPESLRVPGLHHASVHGDHVDLVLARNPDWQVGGRIWAKQHREHQDRPTKYAEIFFFSYTNDSPQTPSNIE